MLITPSDIRRPYRSACGQLGSCFSIQLCKFYVVRLVGWLGGRADGLLRANVCCIHASLRANVCCTRASDPRSGA